VRLLLPILLAVSLQAQTLQRAEQLWRAHDYAGANQAFKAAVAALPKDPELRVRWGRLFLERYNRKDAGDLFNEALSIKPGYAPALLGLALVANETFEGKSLALAQKALEADPKLVEAREFMARLKLEDSDPKGAAAEADAALQIAPNAEDALAVRASVELLGDRSPQPWLDKMVAKDAHNGRGFETVAHFLVMNRRYDEGIQYYQKAVAADSHLDSAYSNLGINLMRMGRETEARQALETAFNHGWKDDATVNSLRLMDSYTKFVTFKTDNTILRLQQKEADVLHPYFETEMKRAMASYDKKYQMHLGRPVQVEVYPDHEDFAVRTLGMPGLGALGVTFGDVVAMDSPSGRKPGDFHWASTLWHEMSHVYVLTATKSRVPRWFTEGVAVHEETAAAPDWGDRLTPDVIQAIKTKKLLPVAEIDRGFIHPSYPSQVIVSYFQAGQICDYISEKWGEHKLLDMIHAFAQPTTTDAVIQKQLGLAPADFDKQFLAWLDVHTKSTVEHYAEWREQIKPMHEAAKAKNNDEVIRIGLKIRDLYPDFVEAGNVYVMLADAYVAKGNTSAALAELDRYAKQGGRDPDTVKRLAKMLAAANRPKEAAVALERLNYIAPQDADLHKQLGTLLLALNNAPGAVREFTALVATKPLDQAGAHYDLARALHLAKQDAKAREEVELSLEAAPSFKPAQKLLLQLSTGASD